MFFRREDLRVLAHREEFYGYIMNMETATIIGLLSDWEMERFVCDGMGLF